MSAILSRPQCVNKVFAILICYEPKYKQSPQIDVGHIFAKDDYRYMGNYVGRILLQK